MRLNFLTVDRLCAAVSLRPKLPTIDLSDVTEIDPYALVYLGQYLRHHNSLGKRFQVRLKSGGAAAKRLAGQRFFQRFNFDPTSIDAELLRPFAPDTSLGDVADIERRAGIAESITNDMMDVLANAGVNVRISAIAEIISELIDNFEQHSGKQLASLAMQCDGRMRQVKVALGDCGVGIRKSLASQPKHSYLRLRPDFTAALKAFEPLASRKREGGMGLVDVKEGIQELGGELTLSTGKGYVQFKGVRTYYGEMAYNPPGVQIDLSIPERL